MNLLELFWLQNMPALSALALGGLLAAVTFHMISRPRTVKTTRNVMSEGTIRSSVTRCAYCRNKDDGGSATCRFCGAWL